MIDVPDDPQAAFDDGGASRIRAALPILTKGQAKRLFKEAVSAAETARERAREDWAAWCAREDRRRQERDAKARREPTFPPNGPFGPNAVLGVAPDASADEIRQAWRRLARTAHPDVQGGSTTLMATINAARDAMLARLGVRP